MVTSEVQERVGSETDSSRPSKATDGTAKGSIVHRVLAALALVLVLGGFSTALAQPASAAPSTARASVCFKHPNGSPYTYDVFAQRYNGGSWVNAGSTRSVNGCSSWTLGAGYTWRFQAFYRVGSSYFIGTSGTATVTGGLNYNYWTNIVRMVGY